MRRPVSLNEATGDVLTKKIVPPRTRENKNSCRREPAKTKIRAAENLRKKKRPNFFRSNQPKSNHKTFRVDLIFLGQIDQNLTVTSFVSTSFFRSFVFLLQYFFHALDVCIEMRRCVSKFLRLNTNLKFRSHLDQLVLA